MAASDYPVQLEIDYPEEPNRLTTLSRVFLAIPILIVGAFVLGGYSDSQSAEYAQEAGINAGDVLFFAPLLMILFRQKYPRWWFDWNVQLLKFETRILAYLFLLQHEYPSTDEDQSVNIQLEYPDAESDLTRWMPLVKWILVIPHYVVLFVLAIIGVFAVIIAWFAILITGSLPRGLFDYIVGVLRYGTRVQAYAFILTTDEYPPFSLKE